MLKPNIKVTLDRTQAVFKALSELSQTRVLAGVPAEETDRSETESEPINNAQLMYVHEHGAPEINLPARPVVGPAIAEIRPDIVSGLRNAGQLALQGNLAGMTRQFNALGLKAQNAMRARITNGPFVPLKPETIRRKGSDKPLIDSGQVRRSLTYVVRKTGQKPKLKA